MNLLGLLGIGKDIKAVSEGLGGLAKDVRTAITGKDPEAQAELEKFLATVTQLQNKAQTETNKVEASHKSIFVAGWRPFIGWVCGFGIAYAFVIYPLLSWAFVAPTLQVDTLYQLVLAMLGMSGLRSYEKAKGVTKNH